MGNEIIGTVIGTAVVSAVVFIFCRYRDKTWFRVCVGEEDHPDFDSTEYIATPFKDEKTLIFRADARRNTELKRFEIYLVGNVQHSSLWRLRFLRILRVVPLFLLKKLNLFTENPRTQEGLISIKSVQHVSRNDGKLIGDLQFQIHKGGQICTAINSLSISPTENLFLRVTFKISKSFSGGIRFDAENKRGDINPEIFRIYLPKTPTP